MAKNKSKVEVKEEQTSQPEQIEEVPQEQVVEVEVKEEQPKQDKKAEKKQDGKKPAKKDNKKKERKPRGKRIKETISELKKVTWPTFGSVVKKTGIVLAVVVIFAVVLFGIDRLLAWLFDLLTNQVA